MSEGFTYPFFQSQVPDIFGDPRAPDFEATYLRTMDFTDLLPSFSQVRDFEGNPWSGKIYGNGYMHAPLRAALEAIIARGLAGEIHTYDGCWNIRQAKGGSIMSMHSWGLALDLDALLNPFGGDPVWSPEFVKCFAQNGFEWGGLWVPDSIRDGMHFQIPWIRVRTGELAPVAWGGGV